MTRDNPHLPELIAPGSANEFPSDEAALSEPNGLIAVGGGLEPQRLLAAYRRGIFPWYEAGQPIMWWTPHPRCMLLPNALHVSRSLHKHLRAGGLEITWNRAFGKVIRSCARPRSSGEGTWITTEMIRAYEQLHRLGHAHSVEVWREKQLVGGLYGVAIGAAFFGESMFSREPDASKVALVALCRQLSDCEAALIDCQVASSHLLGLGAKIVPRTQFLRCLGAAIENPSPLPNC